jgi:hypothetical protein
MKEEQLKHLEFIQGVIARMGANSFKIKGLTVTFVAALLALCASSQNAAYLFVGLVPTIVFWLLDTYYLQLERRYCGLYNDAANNKTTLFSMSIKEYNKAKDKKYSFCNVFWSPTIAWLYGIISLLLLVGGLVVILKNYFTYYQ